MSKKKFISDTDPSPSDQRILQSKLNELEANRQEIIDPYENVTDLSAMLSNPFANLSVATQATEMQMEQTDIALANTLDTIRATGGGAGGAVVVALLVQWWWQWRCDKDEGN